MKWSPLPGEEPWLQEVLDDPHDETARQVYADWLESMGDLRAEWIRVEAEFVKLKPWDAAFRWTRKRLRALQPRMDRSWLALVTRGRIHNCPHALEWGAECPQRWEDCRTGDDPFLRTCRACHERVRFCVTEREARDAAAGGDCATIDPATEPVRYHLNFRVYQRVRRSDGGTRLV